MTHLTSRGRDSSFVSRELISRVGAPTREINSRDTKDESLPLEVKWVIAGPNPKFPKRGAAPYFYQGPVLERMSGEQLWDSLVSLNYPDLDTRINERARSLMRVSKSG